jgi:hypothetical protein
MLKLKFILILIGFEFALLFGQTCYEYENWGNCKIIMRNNFKMFLQPKNTMCNLSDTLVFNVALNGETDYIISLCAEQSFYPINIKLIVAETGIELYDNTIDDYIESIGLGMVNAQHLIIKVALLANIKEKLLKESNKNVCVGLSIQSKTFKQKKSLQVTKF